MTGPSWAATNFLAQFVVFVILLFPFFVLIGLYALPLLYSSLFSLFLSFPFSFWALAHGNGGLDW